MHNKVRTYFIFPSFLRSFFDDLFRCFLFLVLLELVMMDIAVVVVVDDVVFWWDEVQ